ncbi:MAG: RNA methyltransferase [Deltaproteobacteria bacterium HGW-Deltaproteobacteria-4]|nr:MAG: RNA methyltransferase [Deltaproteobacteria bacterium HGW-Deltaproteobacteria-4]
MKKDGNADMANLQPQRLAIILCSPQQPGNIGATVRAMSNFGVTDLRLVNPCPHLHPEARKFAVNAHPLLGTAKVYSSLPDALADCHLSIATTRRSGRLRGDLLDSTAVPELLATLPPDTRIALVFGREDSGLSSEEVALCSHAATVATTNELGSLNLAQAVLLFLYEIFRPQTQTSPPSIVPEDATLPQQAELQAMLGQMDAVLERIAFLNPSSPAGVRNKLHHLLSRTRPDQEEVALLRGMWTQIAWSINDWRGRKRGG